MAGWISDYLMKIGFQNIAGDLKPALDQLFGAFKLAVLMLNREDIVVTPAVERADEAGPVHLTQAGQPRDLPAHTEGEHCQTKCEGSRFRPKFSAGMISNILRQIAGVVARLLPPGHSSLVKIIGQFSIATFTPRSLAY